MRSHRWLTCLSSAVMVCSVMLGSAFWKGRMAPGHRLDLMTESKISEACLHRYKPTRLTTVSFVLICMYSVKKCFYVYMYTHLKWIEYHNHTSLLNSYNSFFVFFFFILFWLMLPDSSPLTICILFYFKGQARLSCRNNVLTNFLLFKIWFSFSFLILW